MNTSTPPMAATIGTKTFIGIFELVSASALLVEEGARTALLELGIVTGIPSCLGSMSRYVIVAINADC
jgi:hypothetical protein